MRKVGDLMSDLGFRKEASFEVKKAFIMHLVKAAYGDSEVIDLEEKKVRRPPKETPQAQIKIQDSEQMEFNFEKNEEKTKVS